MARQKNVLSRALDVIAGSRSPSVDKITAKLSQARSAVETTERAWRLAATAVEADGADPSIEREAEAGLAKARAEVHRLEAILGEVQSREAADADAARAALAAQERAQTKHEFDKLIELGEELQTVIGRYADLTARIEDQAGRCRARLVQDPNVLRKDIGHELIMLPAVQREITRAKPDRLAPGADQFGPTRSNPATWQPLSERIRQIAEAVIGRDDNA